MLSLVLLCTQAKGRCKSWARFALKKCLTCVQAYVRDLDASKIGPIKVKIYLVKLTHVLLFYFIMIQEAHGYMLRERGNGNIWLAVHMKMEIICNILASCSRWN